MGGCGHDGHCASLSRGISLGHGRGRQQPDDRRHRDRSGGGGLGANVARGREPAACGGDAAAALARTPRPSDRADRGLRAGGCRVPDPPLRGVPPCRRDGDDRRRRVAAARSDRGVAFAVAVASAGSFSRCRRARDLRSGDGRARPARDLAPGRSFGRLRHCRRHRPPAGAPAPPASRRRARSGGFRRRTRRCRSDRRRRGPACARPAVAGRRRHPRLHGNRRHGLRLPRLRARHAHEPQRLRRSGGDADRAGGCERSSPRWSCAST